MQDANIFNIYIFFEGNILDKWKGVGYETHYFEIFKLFTVQFVCTQTKSCFDLINKVVVIIV